MILSVCIPTYNRREYLRALLDDLSGELMLDGDKMQFEVCIIDNASTDGSGEMLRDYQKRLPRIKVIHNPINVGMEGNIINAMLAGTGKYTWLLSDHQRIRAGIIAESLAVLERYQPALVCMAIEQWQKPLLVDHTAIALNQLSSAERGALFFTIGNMSSLLVETSMFRSVIANAYRISCFNYPHLAVISAFRADMKICQLSAASRFPDSKSSGAVKRSYDTFRASFIHNLRCVRSLKPSIAISTAEFQTQDYKKALGVELAKILAFSSASRWSVWAMFGRAWVTNFVCPAGGVCSWTIFSAAVLYIFPLKLRRWVLMTSLSFLRPDSLLLKSLKESNI